MKNTSDLPKPDQELVKELGSETKRKIKKKDEKVRYTANFNDLCDLVIVNKKVRFLLNTGEIVSRVIIDEKKYLPPIQEDLDYLVPNAKSVIESYNKHEFVQVTTDTTDSERPSTINEKELAIKDKITYNNNNDIFIH